MVVSAKELTRLANLPEIRPHIAPGTDHIDLSAFYDRPGNVALGDEFGAVLFAMRAPGIFEIHFLLSKDKRGAEAIRSVTKYVDDVFTRYNAHAIYGYPPRENRAVRVFGRRLGFTPTGHIEQRAGKDWLEYVLDMKTWAKLSVA